MAPKEINLAQIAEHNDGKSCWISIDGKVYDVTKFLDEHPGGEEVVLETAGTDATEAFEDVGHSTDARKDLEKYLIGELPEDEKEKAKEAAAAAAKASAGGGNGMFLILAVIAAVFAYLYTQQ